jgi:hypothetical protein
VDIVCQWLNGGRIEVRRNRWKNRKCMNVSIWGREEGRIGWWPQEQIAACVSDYRVEEFND